MLVLSQGENGVNSYISLSTLLKSLVFIGSGIQVVNVCIIGSGIQVVNVCIKLLLNEHMNFNIVSLVYQRLSHVFS